MNNLLTFISNHWGAISLVFAVPGFLWYMKLITQSPIDRLEVGLKESIKSVETGLNKSIESAETRQKESIKSVETGLNKSIESAETRQKESINDVETRLKESINDVETRLKESIKSAETRQKDSILALGTKVDGINENTIKNTAEINIWKHSIDEFNKWLFKNRTGLSGRLSPLCLTKQGEDLAKELKATVLIAKHVDAWTAHLDLQDGAHKLVIEEACIDFCRDHLLNKVSSQESEKIMDAIFVSSESRLAVLQIYGIILRDTIFKQRGIEIPKREKASAALP